ncbi:MAG: hypothetical protein J7498_03345 [Sphingobium sp.]|nr:hypothetical protein [Sphingobium sp.]
MSQHIENQRMGGTEFHVDLSNLTIVNANVEGLAICANDIHALLQPLLERRHEARKGN